MIAISLCPGVDVLLYPQRALLWPAAATLFVADLHLGKADVFHSAGIPIPAAVTQDDLDRLGALLDQTAARRLVILGDFFHAAGSRTPGVFDAFTGWRGAHAAVEILLVSGNHDRHAGPPPDAFGITTCGEALDLGPFHCVHAPLPDPPRYTLCGHLHPVAHLHAAHGADSVRLPCFHVGPYQAILPAFSAFTGGKAVRAAPGDRLFVIAGGKVLGAPGRGG